jgi:hypothetical protein
VNFQTELRQRHYTFNVSDFAIRPTPDFINNKCRFSIPNPPHRAINVRPAVFPAEAFRENKLVQIGSIDPDSEHDRVAPMTVCHHAKHASSPCRPSSVRPLVDAFLQPSSNTICRAAASRSSFGAPHSWLPALQPGLSVPHFLSPDHQSASSDAQHQLATAPPVPPAQHSSVVDSLRPYAVSTRHHKFPKPQFPRGNGQLPLERRAQRAESGET